MALNTTPWAGRVRMATVETQFSGKRLSTAVSGA